MIKMNLKHLQNKTLPKLFLTMAIFGMYACSDFDDVTPEADSEAKDGQTIKSATSRIAGLTDGQLREYLHYYSPIIFKQANEFDNEHRGHDWITNFDFDKDGYLANNKENWAGELKNYVNSGEHTNWQIRPTLYSGLILFHDNSLNTNSVVLLYHVYHAKQRWDIHDWERIEIRIDDVNGAPGNGEEINYVVVTRHSLHNAREYPHEDLNFMETAYGKHVMIWQADWDFSIFGPSQAELHFVEESWNDVDNLNKNNRSARVDINAHGRTRFHYVFVDEADPEATEYWKAQTINSNNARSLSSGKRQGETVSMSEVKKIKYELQDLADIIPTHLDTRNWKDALEVRIVTPILSENGITEVAEGTQTFYYRALDTQDDDDQRKGYIRKHWFWGVYQYSSDGEKFYDELGPGAWYQHQYFAHNGIRGNGSIEYEMENCGIFLGKGEYQNWNTTEGGFDGRWVQLFQD